MNLYILMAVMGTLGFLYFYRRDRRDKYFDYLNEYSRVSQPKRAASRQQVVDLKILTGGSYLDKLRNWWGRLQSLLGRYSVLKLFGFWVMLFILSQFFNDNFLQTNIFYVFAVALCVGSYVGYQWLQSRQRKVFEETFPIALNMLTSAVSSGESITQAIAYVGEALDGRVAEEFRLMAKRLQLGESPEDVFRKACVHLSYPTFYFFVITLRANMERGGQLKDIIQRLNKLMFNIRAIEKKKYAMTSEARASTKIVGAIPLVFILVMRFVMPGNFDFLMHDPSGRVLLYYTIASEVFGMAIVWWLMKSVR